MPAKDEDEAELIAVEGRQVRVTHPEKLYFSRQTRLSKLDLVRYYLSVAPGALNGITDRPIVLKRFVNGAEGEAFYQKRAPSDRPSWLRTVTLAFPSGRTAEELVVDDAAGLAWIVNLGCIELHPHPVRSEDLEHPDELRVDLDPGPGVSWADVLTVALEVNALLDEVGLKGWVKTSGSRGMHVIVRIEPRWSFTEVRRAALALSRAVERRLPAIASSKWWKEERHGVFLDYNQNAKDRTTCSAYSVRPLPDARVSTPLRWDEVADCDPADFTVFTVPKRFATAGDPHQAMDSAAGSLEMLLELAAKPREVSPFTGSEERSPSIPAVEPLRAVRTCNPSELYPSASGGTATCGETCRPACARIPLRPRVRAAAVPRTGPCPGSSGSG